MYTSFCFSIPSLPGVFQIIIDQIIQGILNTVDYLDDILISEQTTEEHNRNLRAVLKRLRDAVLHLRGDKCEFKKSSISQLGHRIDAEGIHSNQKVNAIRKVPTPINGLELRSLF